MFSFSFYFKYARRFKTLLHLFEIFALQIATRNIITKNRITNNK